MLKVANSVINASRITGVLPVVNGGTGVTTSTGTGNTVLSATPTLSGNVTLSTGNLVIGTAGKGIDFTATTSGSGTMTSELLADYEEGTWTPTDASGASLTFTLNAATYTKIGRLVTCNMALTYPVTASVLTARIGGLPFTSGSYGSGTIQGSIAATTATITMRGIYGGAGATTFQFDKNNATAGAENADLSGDVIYATIIYQA